MGAFRRDDGVWRAWGTRLGLVVALTGCGSETEVDVTDKITIEAGVAGFIRWVEYGADDGVEDSGPLPDEIVIVHPAADPAMEAGRATTDTDGFYEIPLPDGDYVIESSVVPSGSGPGSGENVFTVNGDVVLCDGVSNPGLGPAWECG